MPELSRDQTRAAERILGDRFATRVRIDAHKPASQSSTVFRAHLEGRGAPESAIVKLPRTVEGRAYNARDLTPPGPAWLLTSEWAGLAFLDLCHQRGGGSRVAPRFFGGDLESGVLVLEDLGDGASLAEALLGDKPDEAENALLAFAGALGRMHAMTAGREAEFDALLARLGRSPDRPYRERRLREEIAKIPATFDELDFEWTPGLVDDVQQVASAMLDPGPFSAYTHGDPCPDNDRMIDGRAVLFDFERGGFRSALLDGSYGRVPFPTCWCVNRLPDWLAGRFETAYRLELIKGVPAAGDDAAFEKGLMEAGGWWLLQNAISLLPRALRLDERWGISTYRQRLLHRFEAFAQRSGRSGHLEALGAFAYLMGQRMRARWPEVQDMPLYPAFRDHAARPQAPGEPTVSG
jgi:hypothetical protein